MEGKGLPNVEVRVDTRAPRFQVGKTKVTVVTRQSPKAGMASQELLAVFPAAHNLWDNDLRMSDGGT